MIRRLRWISSNFIQVQTRKVALYQNIMWSGHAGMLVDSVMRQFIIKVQVRNSNTIEPCGTIICIQKMLINLYLVWHHMLLFCWPFIKRESFLLNLISQSSWTETVQSWHFTIIQTSLHRPLFMSSIGIEMDDKTEQAKMKSESVTIVGQFKITKAIRMWHWAIVTVWMD